MITYIKLRDPYAAPGWGASPSVYADEETTITREGDLYVVRRDGCATVLQIPVSNVAAVLDDGRSAPVTVPAGGRKR